MLVALVGLMANVALVSNIFGKMSAAIQHLSTAIDKLNIRMDEFDSVSNGSATDRAGLNIRMAQVERNTQGLQDLRVEVASKFAQACSERAQHHDCLQRQERRLDECFAQLRAVALGGANRLMEVGGPR